MKLKILIFTSTLILAVLTALFMYLYILQKTILFYSLSITFFTMLYHFIMRIVVGFSFEIWFPKSNIKYNNFWYREKHWENALCATLKMKSWGSKVPAYYKKHFDK